MNQLKNYCKNCSCVGHYFENCRHPIVSYGIILVDEKEKSILLSKRKNSLSLIEILKGRYRKNDYFYIYSLLSNINSVETDLIIKHNYSYIKIFKHCFGSGNINLNTKKKFDSLFKETIYQQILINKPTSPRAHSHSHWGFPKGRIELNESPLKCALREFYEETGIDKVQIMLQNTKPLTEIFFGTNGKMYKHTYYIAFSKLEQTSELVNEFVPNSEISEIGWFSFSEAKVCISAHYQKRINIIEKLESSYS